LFRCDLANDCNAFRAFRLAAGMHFTPHKTGCMEGTFSCGQS
jgi:hypothetical protein